jgi:hypothetical protein
VHVRFGRFIVHLQAQAVSQIRIRNKEEDGDYIFLLKFCEIMSKDTASQSRKIVLLTSSRAFFYCTRIVRNFTSIGLQEFCISQIVSGPYYPRNTCTNNSFTAYLDLVEFQFRSVSELKFVIIPLLLYRTEDKFSLCLLEKSMKFSTEFVAFIGYVTTASVVSNTGIQPFLSSYPQM